MNCCSSLNTGRDVPPSKSCSLACSAEEELSSELVHVVGGSLQLLVSHICNVLYIFAGSNGLSERVEQEPNDRLVSVMLSVV